MRGRSLKGHQRGNTSECPRGSRMALKDYSDNEAVRSRGYGTRMVSAVLQLYIFFVSWSLSVPFSGRPVATGIVRVLPRQRFTQLYRAESGAPPARPFSLV